MSSLDENQNQITKITKHRLIVARPVWTVNHFWCQSRTTIKCGLSPLTKKWTNVYQDL